MRLIGGRTFTALDLATGKPRWSGKVGDHFTYCAHRHARRVRRAGLRSAKRGRVSSVYARPCGSSAAPVCAAGAGLTADKLGVCPAPERSDQQLRGRARHFLGRGCRQSGTGGVVGRRKLLWSRDWSAARRETMLLLAVDGETLVMGQGMKLTSVEARSGKARWELELATSGARARSGRERGRADDRGPGHDAEWPRVRGSQRQTGRHVADDGSLAVPSPDGTQVAVTTGRQLKWYAADGRLQWVFRGDDTLLNPRFLPDGKRLAVGSELGMLHVFAIAAGGVQTHDLGALAVPAWLPDGDLVAATWMGTVCRLGPRGKRSGVRGLGRSRLWSPLPRGPPPPLAPRSGPTRRPHPCRSLQISLPPMRLSCGRCLGTAWLKCRTRPRCCSADRPAPRLSRG